MTACPDPAIHALFVHGGALGDFILSLTIVKALRQCGAGHITLLGKPLFAELAQQPGMIDAVIDIDTRGTHALFSEDEVLPATLSEQLASCDIAIDTLGGFLPTRLNELGIPRVISIDPRPRAGWTSHITEQWLADLRETGLDAQPEPPRICIAADPKYLAHCIPGLSPSLVEGAFSVMQPGSGSVRKCWPADDFVTIGRHLRAIGLPPIVLLGPVEDECMPQADRDSFVGEFPVAERLPLPDVARPIAAARLYIGNDSGISHLAAAVGTPTVTVFGPTRPELWRPLGPRVSAVAPEDGCPWPTQDQVIDAIRECLEANAQELTQLPRDT